MTNRKTASASKLYAGVQLTRPLLRNINARVEKDLAGTGISVGQRAILEVLLQAEQATAPEITDMLQVTRQFVARELKSLLQKEMVETIQNPRHRRSDYYRLTALSRADFVRIRHREMEQFQAFASRFSLEEIEAYYEVQMALNEEFSSQR